MKPEQFDECFTIGLTAAGEPVERPIRAMTGDEFLMAWEWHQASAARLEEEGAAVLDRLSDKVEEERLTAAGVDVEWSDIVRDLDRVEQVTIEQGAKRFVLRPQAPGCAGAVFEAVGVALPPLIQQIPTGPPPAKVLPLPRRRRRPRCGATSP